MLAKIVIVKTRNIALACKSIYIHYYCNKPLILWLHHIMYI